MSLNLLAPLKDIVKQMENNWFEEYKRGDLSYEEFISNLFPRFELKEENELHMKLDDDHGRAWRELVVKEHFPQYFFKP